MPALERRGAMWRWAGRAVLLLGGVSLAMRFGVPALHRAAGDTGTGRGRSTIPPSLQARGAGHETEDMQAPLMFRLVFGMGFAVLLVIGGMFGLERLVTGIRHRAEPPLTVQQTTAVRPPSPNLQADPLGEIAALRQREDALLDGYGWVDAAHTAARIPIDRAMQLTIGQPLDAAPQEARP